MAANAKVRPRRRLTEIWQLKAKVRRLEQDDEILRRADQLSCRNRVARFLRRDESLTRERVRPRRAGMGIAGQRPGRRTRSASDAGSKIARKWGLWKLRSTSCLIVGHMHRAVPLFRSPAWH